MLVRFSMPAINKQTAHEIVDVYQAVILKNAKVQSAEIMKYDNVQSWLIDFRPTHQYFFLHIAFEDTQQ